MTFINYKQTDIILPLYFYKLGLRELIIFLKVSVIIVLFNRIIFGSSSNINSWQGDILELMSIM